MVAAAAALQEIHDVLQVCGISGCVAFTRLIDIERFNSLNDFSVVDGYTDVL